MADFTISDEFIDRLRQRVATLKRDLEWYEKRLNAALVLRETGSHPLALDIAPASDVMMSTPQGIVITEAKTYNMNGHGAETLPAAVERVVAREKRPLSSPEIRRLLLDEGCKTVRLRDPAAFYSVLQRLVIRERLVKNDEAKYALGPNALSAAAPRVVQHNGPLAPPAPPPKQPPLLAPVPKLTPKEGSTKYWHYIRDILQETRHPLQVNEIIARAPEGVEWSKTDFKDAVKRRKEVFELIGPGVYALRTWPEEVKAPYRRAIFHPAHRPE